MRIYLILLALSPTCFYVPKTYSYQTIQSETRETNVNIYTGILHSRPASHKTQD